MNAIAHMVAGLVPAKPRIRTRRAVIPRVTPRVAEVAKFVADNPGTTRAAVAAHFGIAANTANIHLQASRLNGLAHCTGMGRWSRWFPGVA